MNEDEKKIKKAIKLLIKLKQERSDPAIAAEALAAFGMCIEKTLIDALSDRDFSVLDASAAALGKLKSINAIPALVECHLKEANSRIKATIVIAVMNIGKPAIPVLSALLCTSDPGKVSIVAHLLGELNAKSSAPLLLSHLQDKLYQSWGACADALVKLGFYVEACAYVRQLALEGADRFGCMDKIEYIMSKAKDMGVFGRREQTTPIDFDKLTLKKFPRLQPGSTVPIGKQPAHVSLAAQQRRRVC